jgi:hypothetical protein
MNQYILIYFKILLLSFTLKGKISKSMCGREKNNDKGSGDLKIYFKNSCKGFAFSSKWVGERICVGKE